MLPKLSHRVISTTLVAEDKTVKFHPMTGKEEKLLLIAKSGEDDDEILLTVKQVVQGCVIDDDFNADKVSIPDLEWMFIQIRKESVSPVTKVSFEDSDDGRLYSFDVELDKIEVIKPEVERIIDLGDDISVQLKWPDAGSFTSPDVVGLQDGQLAAAVLPKSIDKVFEGDRIIDISNYSDEEVSDWIDTFPNGVYPKILDFLSKMPRLNYVIKYTNSNGKDREIVLTTLSDFFTF